MSSGWILISVFTRLSLVRQTFSDSYATIPGMLRHLPYDSVLIGTSMCKIFRISDINRNLNVSAVKATSAGQTGDDCARIIQLLTTEKRGTVRHIILGVDIWSFRNSLQVKRVFSGFLNFSCSLPAGPDLVRTLLWIILAFVICFLFPPAYTCIRRFRPSIAAWITTIVLLVSSFFSFTHYSPFIYFNF